MHVNQFQQSPLLKPNHDKPKTSLPNRANVKVSATSNSTTSQQLISSGVVRAVPPKDASSVLTSEGFRLLDVRPEWERERAYVKDSMHVPLFVEDTDVGPVTLLKKWVHFGYIGLWTGQCLTTINDGFLEQVEAEVPNKDEKLLVACGEGLRSMIAVRMLHNGGYKNLGWLGGGFNRTGDTDFTDVRGTTKLQYATIGGVSYYFLQVLFFLQVLGKDS
ncbi:Rhodanese-like domain-containing protein 10 [Acorus gramineus]|uniref:Rhodanese-like domain-containing protein 10 n=1 Tax=Acorus gramineus TaxID=55184 RepID=A0AAV9B4M9_ACOGR|nr:Rhodanese-like domain-containing protein 10 [Acorus gramineus]KAK1271575.1 Rhodanese-like domain-containing protein 10 [Acorus gramineus]